MRISSRFTVAVHTLLCVDYFRDKKVTSEFIASSVRVNPVVIRRTLLQLRNAGLIRVARGRGGAELIPPLAEITLLDVYRAVKCGEEELFHFHENPNPACPVGGRVRGVLDRCLAGAQSALEAYLGGVTLSSLAEGVRALNKEDDHAEA